MINTFNQFLEEKYDEVDNDSNNMNEAFEAHRDRWFENLDTQEIINFGEEYGAYVAFETASNIHDKITTETLRLHDEFKNLTNKREK